MAITYIRNNASTEIINTVTDSNGEVNDTYSYVGDQGRVRKGT